MDAAAENSTGGGSRYVSVDEYALATRLSYFLWSSMPDERIVEPRAAASVASPPSRNRFKRMLADRKSEAFVRNFVGQWLQVRDIDTVQIDARQVLRRENFDPQMRAAAQAPPRFANQGGEGSPHGRRKDGTRLAAHARSSAGRIAPRPLN